MRLAPFALALSLAACQPDADPAPEIDAGPVERAVDAPVATADRPRLNLNTATEDEFKALGVGDRMAHEFAEYRPYASVREFRREIGKYIDNDPVQLAEYERMVFVPVDPETADAETLRQLPGVTASEAVRLVEGRPYADADAFLAAYAQVTGRDAEAARVYLAE